MTETTGSADPNKKPGAKDGGQNKGRKGKKTTPPKEKFKGRTSGLEGHVYDYAPGSNQSDAYIKTTDEIAEYAQKTCTKYSADISRTISDLQAPTIPAVTRPVPIIPADTANRLAPVYDPLDQTQYQASLKIYDERIRAYEQNKETMYAVVWGQCSDTMRQKVEGDVDYETIKQHNDLIGLLESIKRVSFNFDTESYLALSIYQVVKRFFTIRQKDNEDPDEYRTRLDNAKNVIESSGGELPIGTALINQQLREDGIDPTNATNDERNDATERAKDALMGIALIEGANNKRYGKMKTDLANNFAKGTDQYPKSLSSAYKLLVTWKNERTHGTGMDKSALAFTNVTEEIDQSDDESVEEADVTLVNKADKTDNSHITCFKCGCKGHYAYENKCDPDILAAIEEAKASKASKAEKPPDGKPVDAKPQKKKPPPKDDKDDEAVTALMAMQGEELDAEGWTFCQVTRPRSPDSVRFVDEDVDYERVEKLNKGPVDRKWLLLDNQSTAHVICNKNLLTDIRPVGRALQVHTQAGVASTNLQGTLKGIGDVWYDPNGIANILSLSKTKKQYRITYDSANGNEFNVHKDDGTIRIFQESTNGLYYLDTSDQKESVSLITTVEDKKSNYTPRDYSRAQTARRLQYTLGNPSTRDFMRIVDKKQISNCPINVEDIKAAEDIFGPSISALKGKTTRTKSEPVKSDVTPMPLSIVERYKDVTIACDVMTINGIRFLVAVSLNIKFGMAVPLENQKIDTMAKRLIELSKIYRKRGFRVVEARMDGQFDSMQTSLAEHGIHLNSASNDEHVPEIERYIRTLKERVRCIWNTLPFKRMPAAMIREMVAASVFWLNSFPVTNGISDTMSPREIVVGTTIDHNKHCKIQFGTYVQTHEEHSNGMEPRTVGAIAMRPTGNAQGGYFFMSLNTGRMLDRTNWTPLPMPAEVIDRVHTLARRSKASKVGLTFGDRNGNIVVDVEETDDDDDDDESYHPDDDDDDDDDDSDDDSVPSLASRDSDSDSDDDDEDYDPILDDDDEDDELAGVPGDDEADGSQSSVDGDLDAPDDDFAPVDVDDDVPIAGVDDDDTNNDDDANDTNNDDDANDQPPPDSPPNLEQEMDDKYGPRSGAYGLRPRKIRNYDHLHAQIEEGIAMVAARSNDPITDTSFKQHYVNKGLKIFGKPGADAVIKELRQLHDMSVATPRMVRELTKEDRQKALQYHMFLKQKKCGKIKGRGCADGRKQREYLSKEDTTSPTVMTESLMLSCVIDAAERRCVATCDLPGAFMQTDTDERIIIKFEGPMAKLLVKVDETLYSKFTVVENGKTVIYAELNKALYGTLKAALLFWQKLTEYLEGQGYERNPYDWCVMNKTINGKQCTILWHVDDLKISHVEQSVVDVVLEGLDAEFGKISPITIARGKVHEYLGMTLDYREEGKVKITMFDYIKHMLDDLPDEPVMRGTAPTPAANHLFQVSDDKEKLLPKDKAETFHHNVAKLLFLYQRARPDLKTAVSFLCTRVQAPDLDDWKKLARVMRYLRGTRNMPLVLEASDLGNIRWSVDGAFAVHPDMKSHTGAMMSLGKGAMYSTSTRQKLNTKSSTEAELVAVDDVMPQVLWTRHFLTAQGYQVTDNVILQDNKSAMLLENNGKRSSGKRTRHIDIRYFFITDRIGAGDVRVEHCPTDALIADYFTKPLQGRKFREFRDVILNIDSSALAKELDAMDKEDAPDLDHQDQDHRSVLDQDKKTV